MNNKKYLAALLLTLAAVYVFFGPRIIGYYFGVDYEKFGQLGDSFGGLTAPIIGLVSALLVYWAFVAQIEANEKINDQIKTAHQETNFTFCLKEIETMQKEIEDFKVVVSMEPHEGKFGIGVFSQTVFRYVRDVRDGVDESDEESVEQARVDSYVVEIHRRNFHLLLEKIQLGLLTINIDLSDQHKRIINTKMLFLYQNNLQFSMELLRSVEFGGIDMKELRPKISLNIQFMKELNEYAFFIDNHCRNLTPLLSSI